MNIKIILKGLFLMSNNRSINFKDYGLDPIEDGDNNPAPTINSMPDFKSFGLTPVKDQASIGHIGAHREQNPESTADKIISMNPNTKIFPPLGKIEKDVWVNI